jgi:hypothetical protein
MHVFVYVCAVVVWSSTYCGEREISRISSAGTSGDICFIKEQNDAMDVAALSEWYPKSERNCIFKLLSLIELGASI